MEVTRGGSGVRMMEEVSISVAYDAHVLNQLVEEDVLVNMLAHTKRHWPGVGLPAA